MPEFVKVSKTADLAPGHSKRVDVGGKKIALFNLEGLYYAIDEICPHRGGPLSEGAIQGHEVTCPWHGAVFNIVTGELVRPPASRGVMQYKTRVNASDIEVEI